MPGKFESPDHAPKSTSEKPDTIATPEGDNEFRPDQPLHPLPEGAEKTPRGSAPDPYKGE